MKINDPITGKEKDVRLPKLFKKKWLEALRSGKFGQGIGKLKKRNVELYCCLGVACKIVNPNLELEGKGFIEKTYFGDIFESIKVPKLLHGNNRNPVVDTLARMNDNRITFNEIADWIEENL